MDTNEAEKNIDEAIKGYVKASTEEKGAKPEMVMEWVICVAAHSVNDNGTTATSYYIKTSDAIALHRAYGLFGYAVKSIEQRDM